MTSTRNSRAGPVSRAGAWLFASLGAALACERGFIGAVAGGVSTVGGIVDDIGGIFGGGGDGPDMGGSSQVPISSGLGLNPAVAWNNNPINWREWRAAWAQATAGQKANAWNAALSCGQTALTNQGAGASDTTRRDLIFWSANGGGNGSHDSKDSCGLRAARALMSQVNASDDLGVQVIPADERTPGQTIDDIIDAIRPTGRTGTEVTPEQATQSAGFGSDTMTLLLGGAVLFLLLQR